MQKRLAWLSALLILGASVGCTDHPPPSLDDENASGFRTGKADTGMVVPGSPEAHAIVYVANTASYETLTGTPPDKVYLDPTAAAAIIAVRVGDDREVGTADDNPFDNIYELDQVPFIGPEAFQAFSDYVHYHMLIGSIDGGVGFGDGSVDLPDAGASGCAGSCGTLSPDGCYCDEVCVLDPMRSDCCGDVLVYCGGEDAGTFFYCGDGVCDREQGEDIMSCADDCSGEDGGMSFWDDGGSACGDGHCESANGEDEMTCPSDCASALPDGGLADAGF